MAEKALFPEKRFLRALYPKAFSERCLDLPFAADSSDILDELRQHIIAALDTLSYRDRGVLEMRFGLGDGYAYTLAEAGYVFNLTRERIRQLQARSLRRLRERADSLEEFLRRLDS